MLTLDDKGLCLSVNSKRDKLFYVEKSGQGNRVVRVDLAFPNQKRRHYSVEDGLALNFTCHDDLSLYVLFMRNHKYFIRVFDVATGSFEEKMVSGRRRL